MKTASCDICGEAIESGKNLADAPLRHRSKRGLCVAVVFGDPARQQKDVCARCAAQGIAELFRANGIGYLALKTDLVREREPVLQDDAGKPLPAAKAKPQTPPPTKPAA